MSQPTSFFLDVLRVVAALTVFFYHCVLFWYPDQVEGLVGHLGHRAVIIFFVLSGYVIAHATWRRETTLRAYAVARLSRLYSVVLPALILTALLAWTGSHLNPSAYASFIHPHATARYFLTAFFLQSLWTLNAAPPTNGPFWSLGYEFWYYAIFAAAVFTRSRPRRIALTGLLVLVSGIDSLLLMPSWLLGVWLYREGRRVTFTKAAAGCGLVVAFVVVIASVVFLPDWPWHYGYPPFFFSSAFLSDALIGLLLAALIWFFDQLTRSSQVDARLDAAVRWAADHTFSLYLYHFPLLLFVTAVVPFNRASGLQVSAMVLGFLTLIVLLSAITQSLRPQWRRFFDRCWDYLPLAEKRSRSVT